MSDGWAKVHRKIMENPHLQDLDALGLFVILFTDAAWQDCEKYVPEARSVIRLKRGQVWASVRSLARRGTSEKRIRTILKMLEKGTLIDTQKGTLGTVITICNYDKYQNDNEIGAHSRAHSGAREGHTRGTPIDKEREEREERKKESSLRSDVARAARSAPTKQQKASQWPDGFCLDPDMIAYAEKVTPGVDAQADFEKFENHHRAKGSKFKDWKRAWMTWCRSEFAKPMSSQGNRHDVHAKRNGFGASHDELAQRLFDRLEREQADAAAWSADGIGSGDEPHGQAEPGRGDRGDGASLLEFPPKGGLRGVR